MFESTADLETVLTNAFTRALLNVRAEEERAKAAARAEAERREAEAEAAEQAEREKLRAATPSMIRQILLANPSGIRTKDLIHAVRGRLEEKRRMLAHMELAGEIVRCRERGRDFIVLTPASDVAA
jgi:hypothetical protein